MTKIHFEAPSPEDYCNLRANAGMSSKSIEAAIKGLPHACFKVTLYENDMLIGMGRVIGGWWYSFPNRRYCCERYISRFGSWNDNYA